MTNLELAQRALESAPQGDGTLVSVQSERSLLLRYARSRPTQSTAVDDVTVEFAVLRDGRVGTASTNATDPDSLAACARQAQAAAEAMARSSGHGTYPGFPSPRPVRPGDSHDNETARVDPVPGGKALADAFEVAANHGVEAHGTWTVAAVDRAVASSEGVALSELTTDAFMKVVCIAPSGRSGYATGTSARVGDIDPRALAERSAAKAAAEGEPEKLEPGEYPVVLERAAVGDLLAMLGWFAFNGLSWVEDRSALSGRLGERVAAPAINLSDSPRYPRTLRRGFDAEGVPKSPLPLIQDGVAQNVVHDTRSAALAEAASTGHALVAGGGAYGPVPTNLVLLGGGAANPEELCQPIERGIYVTRLWYLNAVRPKETLLTGVTRDGTFLIEDGKVTRPVADMRFTDSALGLLERTQALTAEPEATSDGEFYGRRFATAVVCPAIRVSEMRFTG
ncbi:MAG TPA: metallopeptidase TldD-related protein [Candidatus Dormibacteraeota bacterium]|nr:metallopeptidase TldD-related protein [Candidatus Dormibacteraeota bacterium]